MEAATEDLVVLHREIDAEGDEDGDGEGEETKEGEEEHDAGERRLLLCGGHSGAHENEDMVEVGGESGGVTVKTGSQYHNPTANN